MVCGFSQQFFFRYRSVESCKLRLLVHFYLVSITLLVLSSECFTVLCIVFLCLLCCSCGAGLFFLFIVCFIKRLPFLLLLFEYIHTELTVIWGLFVRC